MVLECNFSFPDGPVSRVINVVYASTMIVWGFLGLPKDMGPPPTPYSLIPLLPGVFRMGMVLLGPAYYRRGEGGSHIEKFPKRFDSNPTQMVKSHQSLVLKLGSEF